MSTLLTLLLSSTLSFAAINFAHPERESLEFGFVGLETVRISSPAGRITLSPMPLNKIMVYFNKRAFTDVCSAQAKRSIDRRELTVSVTRPEGSPCEADIEMIIPTDLNLFINSDSGKVELKGMKGNLNFTIGSGSLVATGGTLKSVNGKVGSGQVDINEVSGGGRVDMGTGSVNIKFSEDPEGAFAVKNGSGNVNLMFPKGMRLKSELVSTAGDLENEFGFDSQSPYAISVTTGAGDIHVKSY